ncbi:MAG: hypothetical protein LBI08_03250 [Methanomassiliicoccaceae archaeon]|jgi:predicted RNA binding protein with dsRBD fold (UPF0201 family)|nr:hypothetical protein [Methanomassiliicoccaceae archaeon]
MPIVRVYCPVFPSEDPEKVRKAVLNIFPGMELSTDGDAMTGSTASLEHFAMQIRRQRILDTTRSILMKGRRGEGRTVFNMNKQAAFAGKISFAEERTILGTINVTIDADDITAFAEALAPHTVNGEEVIE